MLLFRLHQLTQAMRPGRSVRHHLFTVFLVFVLSTMLFVLFLERSSPQLDPDEEQERATEGVRLRMLKELQQTIFQHPNRPPDERYNLNVTLSEHTPMERELPQIRPPICETLKYDISKLPTISVIIPFYNEALSMLLRTVHSILQRTPPSLLKDIIIIDDHSPNEDLGEPLEKYVQLLPSKVQLLRTAHREGLIRARIIGARIARGQVLFFQDAHIENNAGWAEPLLEEIRKNRRTIIQPHVDQIEQFTLAYNGEPIGVVPRGGFSWDLRYTWMQMPEHEKKRLKNDAEPFRTPTLVGCALAADKEYFFHIGAFDDAMNIWGGENIELAFRNWMCGGQVLTHPCSRVAHVFKPFAYHFDGDREKIVQKNLMRIAELWMDDWKKFFYAATYSWEVKHTYFTEQDISTLNRRKELKKKLQCKGFGWFLRHIISEVPTPESDAWYYGEVANEKSEACWFATNDGYVGLTYFCYFHRVLPQNIFRIASDGRLMYRKKCVHLEPTSWLMRLGECDLSKPPRETWDVIHFAEVTGMTRVKFTYQGEEKHMCVLQVTNINAAHKGEQMPQMADCDESNPFQRWRWTYKFDFNYNFDKPFQ